MGTLTQSQLATVKRALDAREGLLDFAAYTFPGYQRAPHLSLVAAALEDIERGECERLMIFMPPRHGKALALDTPIPTPDGWRYMAELETGDSVFGADGAPCRVVATSPTWRERPCYRVRTDDGDEIVADAEHLWRSRLDGKRPVFKLHTTERLARPRKKRAMIERQGALQMPARALPIASYTLGVWLGDGCSNHATITQGSADYDEMRANVEADGYETSDRATDGTFGVLGIQRDLRALDLLGNKHIPAAYLRSSAGQRLALLQGLIDTDGYVAPDGQVEFCSVSQRLALDAHELVCSLGYKASVIVGRATLDGRDCGAKYRVMFYMAAAARLRRKAVRCRDAQKTMHRYVTAEPCGQADTRCIQVDAPDGMFLAGRSMLPTHNSELVSIRFPAWYLGRHPDAKIIAASHQEDLAGEWGRQVRNVLEAQPLFPLVKLAGDSKAKALWHTTAGGQFLAVGVGSGVVGFGGNLILIDDPHGKMGEHISTARLQQAQNWWQSEIVTRQEPGAAIVIIMHRWHEADLAGWLLSQNPERWRVLSLPAIAEESGHDWREPGEALWPERYGLEALQGLRIDAGERTWASLYQQRPAPEAGDVFRWWPSYRPEELPPLHKIVVPFDSALGGEDFTAWAAWGFDGSKAYLLNAGHYKGDQPEAVKRIARFTETMKALYPNVPVLPLGRGNVGIDKAMAQQLRSRSPNVKNGNEPIGMGVGEVKLPGLGGGSSAEKREGWARIASVEFEGGRALIPFSRGEAWLEEWLAEHKSFPNAKHDDWVETTCIALWHLFRADTTHKPHQGGLRVYG